MKYEIAIPSRGRPKSVITIQNIQLDKKLFTIFVDSLQEASEYQKANPGVKVVVTGKRGITKTRNFILDYYPENSKIVTMCDDIQAIQRLSASGKTLITIVGGDLDTFIQKGFEICMKNKTKLWGVYAVPNYFFMSHTLSPDGFIIGTFSGIIISGIRMDEQLSLKEDYDFTIKHILKYKKVVRFNNYVVKAKHYSNKGGCVSYRTPKREEVSINRLLELYPEYIRLNPRRENEILLKFPRRKKC